MKQQWYKAEVPCTVEEHQVIIAWCNVLGVDAIVEKEEGLEVYWIEMNEEHFKQVVTKHSNVKADQIVITEVEDKNWNAEWEANFDPIVVGNILVRAPFHDPAADGQTEIKILPKMAFGTGHHETTFMMLEELEKMDLVDKSILDYGCGTSVLAVYTAMKKASRIVAIDIQIEAVENSIEHVELNNLPENSIDVRQGDLDVLDDENYDVILANINRHVLLKNARNLARRLNDNGQLLMSGILKRDENIVLEEYLKSGFKLNKKNYKGDWCLFVFDKVF